MAQTLINNAIAVNDKAGYAGYTFRLEVIMNSYNSTNATYNVTINHYAKGDTATNHKYNGLTTPKSTITAYVGSTAIVNQTVTVSTITGSELRVNTWTGNIQANADGNLTVRYVSSYAANKSSSYLPRNNSNDITIKMPTIPRYATITSYNLNRVDETTLNVTWSANVPCNAVQYRIRQSGGSYGNWIGAGGTNFNIGSLTPNTTYIVQIQVRRTDSGLWTQSGEPRQTTYNYPNCTSSQNFVIGEPVELTVYNDLNREYTLELLGNNDAVIGTYTGTEKVLSLFDDSESVDNMYENVKNLLNGSTPYKIRVTYGTSVIIRDSGNTFSVDIEANRPTFEDFASNYTANLTNLTNNNQTVIDNTSTVTYTITHDANAKNGATIDHYDVVWGNVIQTINDISSPVSLEKGNGNHLTITAYDSRNISNTIQVAFSDFVNYVLPSNMDAKAHRLNGIEATSFGDLSGTIYYDKFGTHGVSNAIKSIKYSVVGGVQDKVISDISSIVYSGQSSETRTQRFSIEDVIIHANGESGGFDVNSTYTIIVTATDLADNNISVSAILSAGKFGMDRYKDADNNYHYGINGVADEDYTQTIYGNLNVVGDFYKDGAPFSSGDTVPYGAMFNYDGDSLPSGYEEADDIVVLYNNESGTNGSITLSEDANDYSYLMVYWRSVWNSTRQGVVMAPTYANNWTLQETTVGYGSDGATYTNIVIYSIIGTLFNLYKAKNYNSQNSNTFYITKIVGYK